MVGWGCRLKPGFSVPVPARCERESFPERNPCPAHSDRWSLVEEGSTPVWAAAGWRGCRLGGCDSVASPLIISISPSLIRRPSPGSRREWVCERGGALKQPGLAACDEAHTWSGWSLITAAVICRVRLSSGDRSLPRACTLVSSWVQEGSVEGSIAAPVHGWRARMPGRLIPGKCRGPRGRRRRWRSRRPSRPGPEGSACGRRTPPLTWTLPSRTLPLLHNPRSTTRTPDPLFILDTSSPLDTLFYYFCWIKASPRPDVTPTVSVVCSSRHSTYKAHILHDILHDICTIF